MTLKYMRRLCNKCNSRPVMEVISYPDGESVGVCRCHRLWDSQSRPLQKVVFRKVVNDKVQMMYLDSGNETMRRLKAGASESKG